VGRVLDIATKPAQWFLGGLEVLFLLVLALGGAVVYPFYLLFSGHSLADWQVWLAITALALLILLVLSPGYVLGCGLISLIAFGCWLASHDNLPHDQYEAFIQSLPSPVLLLRYRTPRGRRMASELEAKRFTAARTSKHKNHARRRPTTNAKRQRRGESASIMRTRSFSMRLHK
jgi:hypothetical protein